MIMKLKLWHAILAGLQIVTAGTALASFIGEKPAALIVLAVGAVQVGLGTYVGDPAQSTPPAPPAGGTPS